MAGHPYSELRSEYERNVAIVRVDSDRIPAIDAAIKKRMITPFALKQYGAIEQRLGIPIVVQASICERESSTDWLASPAQGDPWNRVSTNVPRNKGPYPNWQAAAYDAWHNIDHLDQTNGIPWSLVYAMWKWEAYNGFGYRAHGIRSPYVVGATNLQQKGRYVSDGKFRLEWDTQIGCLAMAIRMIALRPELAFGQQLPQVAAPLIIPDPAPVPYGVGGSLTGTVWLQHSLNQLMLPGSDALAEDGNFGRFTRWAYRNYQVSIGEEPTGIITDSACDHIDADLRRKGLV